jgi:hypothetical protein
VYRGEYLQRPRHNALAYDRVPRGNIILFDVNTGLEEYVSREEKEKIAEELNLEIVPCLYRGMVANLDQFNTLLETISILGGQKIEGVVCKQEKPTLFGPDKKALMGKYVSADFKEVHKGSWKESNPGRGDIVQSLISRYRTPARWAKAVQHLREAGQIQGSPTDIGAIIKECHRDFMEECGDECAAALWAHFSKEITRSVAGGIPEWYKEQLLKTQFGEGSSE